MKNHMMKTYSKQLICFALFILLNSLNTFSQSIERKVIASGGINYQSATLNVSSTIGETFITTIGNSGLLLTQGFQQPVPYNCTFVLNNGQDTIAACGTSYTLDAGAGYSSYSWSNGSTNQTATVNATGWYKCTVTQGLCTASDSVFVSLVDAHIINNDTTVCSGSSIILSVSNNYQSDSIQLPNNLKNGLVLYYPFNGSSSDLSGNANDGILSVNPPALTTDRFGIANHAYEFGLNNLISRNINNYSTFSVSAWAQFNAINGCTSGGTDGSYFVSHKDVPSYGNGFAIGQVNGNWSWINYNTSNNQWQQYPGPIQLNKWYHVVQTYDTNGKTYLYVDGVKKDSMNYGNVISGGNNYEFKVGGEIDGNTVCWFKGKIDDVMYYNRAITPEEVSQIYNLNSGTTFIWSNGATTPSISVNPTQTTTYYCTVSNGISSCIDSVTVTVNNLNANLFTQDTIAACGTSYTLDAGAGYSSYTWSNGSTGQTATINATSWYKCTVTQGSCSATDSVFVSLVEGQIINNDTTVCSNTVVSLAVQNGQIVGNQSFVVNSQLDQLISSNYLSFTGPSQFTSPNLIPGNYYLKVSGSYCGNSCSAGREDAAYDFYNGNIPINHSFTRNEYCPQGTSGCSHPRPVPDVYNPNHIYYYPFVSTGGTQTIYGVADECCWGDNWGGLTFEFYRSYNNSTYQWSTGATTPTISVTPTQTTTYYCTVSNGISSCTDSVTITANPTSTSSTAAAACDAYQWNGNTYTASGTYTYTTTNSVGCDSVATLNLTITPSSTNTTSITSCGTYNWSVNGQTYAQSGTYSSLSNCHTEILNLTVLPVPSMPVIACYQTASFNNATCSWDIAGPQPTQPTLACYETATFNNTTCSWEVTGSQPTQPALACYETATFNNTTCVWDVTGTMPTTPTVACYETATFNNTTCTWDITGSQPAQPTLACWANASFNNTTCNWDITGSQPIQPNLACYETATFNNTTCNWDIIGSQPAQPTLACYETATFNNTTCVWDVTGTMPTTPTVVCYETATFNNTTCVWDVTGTMPTTPTLACYETATFNTSTCQWDVTGSSAAPIITTDNGCDSYTWSANGQVYTQSGTFNYSVNCQVYTLNLTITNSTVYYQDQDFDGYGNANSTTNSCNGVPVGYVAISGDCNDNNANINPGATEICGNGIDDNCNGNIDEGCACINPPTTFAGADTAICAGSNIQLYGSIGGGASNAIWTTSGSGVFMPSANLLNAMYVPSATDISSGAVTLTLTTNAVAPCNAAISAMVLTLNPVPAGLGPITGPTDICYPLNNIFTYSVAPIPGASTYTWTVPAGTVIQGSATGSTIQVKFINDNVHLSILGNITVTAGNSYGCVSAPSSLALQVQITAPIQPSSISGPVSACTGDIAVYSVSPVFRAMTYNWTLPTGATIIGGGSTNIITVEYNAAFTGGNISVSASNVCGTGATRSRTVSRNILPAPSTIIGPVDGLCNATNVTYSVTPINGASSYNWTLPIGFTITSGAGTNSITVDVSSSFTTGSVAVAAVNACGAGLARSITVKAVPGIPAAISGPVTSCVSSVQNYSTQPVIGAVSYTWTVPGGAVINNGQGTKNIDITYGSVASSTGIITVKASNTCGISNVRVLSVKTTNCPRAGSTSGLIINLNPNPTTGLLNIESNEAIKQIEVFDMLGKLVLTYGNEKQIDLSNLNSGLYLIRFTSENGVEQRRVEVSR